MLGFQAVPRLFSGQAVEQFCLCSSEYKMSMCHLLHDFAPFQGGCI